MSASPSTASEMVHVRACIRCIAMACCLPQLLLFLLRHTDEISALHTQPKRFAVSICAYCCRVCVKAHEAQGRCFSSCKMIVPNIWNLHLQRCIIVFLDHINKVLVLRRPSARASESFLLACLLHLRIALTYGSDTPRELILFQMVTL